MIYESAGLSVFAATILGVILTAITIVDIRHMMIPNGMNAALALSGLLVQAIVQPDQIWVQCSLALAVFILLATLRKAHTAATGRVGLGFGDVKMLAAAACWVSPWLFPLLLFIASASALAFVGGRIVKTGPAAAKARTPFGPFIAFGLAVTWTFEQMSPFY